MKIALTCNMLFSDCRLIQKHSWSLHVAVIMHIFKNVLKLHLDESVVKQSNALSFHTCNMRKDGMMVLAPYFVRGVNKTPTLTRWSGLLPGLYNIRVQCLRETSHWPLHTLIVYKLIPNITRSYFRKNIVKMIKTPDCAGACGVQLYLATSTDPIPSSVWVSQYCWENSVLVQGIRPPC